MHIENGIDLLIHGNIVLPLEVLNDSWVSVKDGVIRGLHRNDPKLDCKENLNYKGSYIFPGIIDDHVHSFSNPEERFEGSTASAALGGVTTIIEMPYDSPVAVTNAEVFSKKVELISNSAKVDVALLSTLKKNAKPDEIAPMIEKGACGFKLSLFETDVKRFPRIEDTVLWEILPELASRGMVVGFHAENDSIIEHLISKYKMEKKTYPLAHIETRPPVTETLSVLKLLELAFWTKVPLHIYHVSHPRSIELIKIFRDQGLNVSSETCPHYLIFSNADMHHLKSYVKINPCLRAKEEVDLMWKYLLSGDIDIVASDHAPWALGTKQSSNIFENASGCPGVQFIFPLMYNEIVVKRQKCPTLLSRLLAFNPARRFNIDYRKGSIEAGKDADFAIVNPTEEWTILGKDQMSVAKWSPYDGKKVKGKVVRTILRGKTIYDCEKGIATETAGMFIAGRKS